MTNQTNHATDAHGASDGLDHRRNLISYGLVAVTILCWVVSATIPLASKWDERPTGPTVRINHGHDRDSVPEHRDDISTSGRPLHDLRGSQADRGRGRDSVPKRRDDIIAQVLGKNIQFRPDQGVRRTERDRAEPREPAAPMMPVLDRIAGIWGIDPRELHDLTVQHMSGILDGMPNLDPDAASSDPEATPSRTAEPLGPHLDALRAVRVVFDRIGTFTLIDLDGRQISGIWTHDPQTDRIRLVDQGWNPIATAQILDDHLVFSSAILDWPGMDTDTPDDPEIATDRRLVRIRPATALRIKAGTIPRI